MTVGRWAYQEGSCKETEATKSPRKTSFKNITGLFLKMSFVGCTTHCNWCPGGSRMGAPWWGRGLPTVFPGFTLFLCCSRFFSTSNPCPLPPQQPSPPPSLLPLGQAASSDVCVYPFICVFLLNLLMCVFVLHESVLWGYHAPCSFLLCTVALRSILLPPPLFVALTSLLCSWSLSLHRRGFHLLGETLRAAQPTPLQMSTCTSLSGPCGDPPGNLPRGGCPGSQGLSIWKPRDVILPSFFPTPISPVSLHFRLDSSPLSPLLLTPPSFHIWSASRGSYLCHGSITVLFIPTITCLVQILTSLT